mgnify:CR=1 FL=1
MNYNNPNDFQREMEKFKNDFKEKQGIIWLVVVGLLVFIGGTTSFYTVEPEEEAIVLRFGRYTEDIKPPGLHFKYPFGIDKVIKVQTKRVLQQEFGFRTQTSGYGRSSYSQESFNSESLMLTGDLNVANVEWVVHYQISDPYNYLFKTSDQPTRRRDIPGQIQNIRDVSESIMRRVVGDRTVTEVLTTGRKEISEEAKKLIQDVLDKYEMGTRVMTVKLQDVNPPDMVKPSFNEVNEAKQEQEKVINQAEKSYNKVIPEAKGKAEQLITEAEGYATALLNRSKGDAARFASILKEYKRAPRITRKRLYLETMESLFGEMENITVVDPKIKGLMPIFNGFGKSNN